MNQPRKMLIGTTYAGPYGVHPGAWRTPWAKPDAYTDIKVAIRSAQIAERGGLDFVFYPDRVFIWGDLETGPPIVSMESILTLAGVAPTTRRIGLVTSASTSFMEPYAIARQLRALDVMSHGRAGWNAIPSYEPEAFANYGLDVPDRDAKYQRLHETIQITQALWGSWKREAGAPDPLTGRFADTSQIQPINMQGRYVASRGPLQIPPSEQGQPVIFMPFASGHGIKAAAMYANGIIGMPSTMEAARSQRATIRSAAEQIGRSPDEVKFLSFVTFGLGESKKDAVERRMILEEAAGIENRLAQLSAVIGVRLDPGDCDHALAPTEISNLRPHPGVLRSGLAVDLARRGLTPREILGHGVLDRTPGLVGTPEEAADMLQAWMETDASDGFILTPDDEHDGIEQFVDLVIPILKQRGLRTEGYDGQTLRDHMGLSEQLGRDPRVSADKQ
jgi:FMN-dependent oxidoreductase (nitrilotriacetate monooxygenase family)